MKNPIVWWELASHFSKESAEFFEKVFGWEFEIEAETNIYRLRHNKEDMLSFSGGEIFTLKKAKLPFLTLYIKVEKIEEMAIEVKINGGHIIEGPKKASERIKICLFNEPSGVTFAMLEVLDDG